MPTTVVRRPLAVPGAPVTMLLGLAVALVAMRRVGGYFTHPLDAGGLAAVGLVAGAVAVAAWFELRRELRLTARNQLMALALGLAAMLAALVAALTVPGTEPTAIVAGGLAALLPPVLTATTLSLSLARLPAAPARRPIAPSKPEPSSEGVEDSFTQRLIRTRTAEGEELLVGELAAEFQPRQRTAYVHVAFCPPFSSAPSIELDADTTQARIEAALVLPHGVRFEVRLSRPAEEAREVRFEFAAKA